jgi:TRAP-type C4-dicarboxylate transport system permease small subunit
LATLNEEAAEIALSLVSMTALSLSIVLIIPAWHVAMQALTVNSSFLRNSRKLVNAANTSESAVPILRMAAKELMPAKAAMKRVLLASPLL